MLVNRFNRCLSSVLAGLFTIAVFSAWSQTADTGQIVGRVADPSDAVIAGASITVKTSSAIPAVDSARPSRSARRARGSREVGTVTATSAAVTPATGTSEKKMLDQE